MFSVDSSGHPSGSIVRCSALRKLLTDASGCKI